MDVLGRLFAGDQLYAGVPGPADDYWYQPVGMQTAAGMRVDDEGAQKLSAWYRGRDILATVLAMLPFGVYRKLPDDGGAEPAPDHPLHDLLHDQPNDGQDSFQWRREQMFDIIDHGWAYDWIVPGPRGFCDQLVPIEPSLVTPRPQYRTLANGARVATRTLFNIRDPQTNVTETFTQDEVFHLRGAGGKGILEYARTSLGTALATESYAASIFGRGSLNGGILTNPGVLDPEASKRQATSFITAAGDWRLPKVLEQGTTFQESTMSPEDFQMLLSRKFSIDDMARWLGVPRMMLENADPSYGNAEQFDQNFLTYSMGNWTALWEFGVKGQLILQPRRFYAEFTRDAIARAKFLERAQGNVAYVNAGIYTVDEVRGTEGRNKRGGAADELRNPQNITGKPGGDPALEPTDPAVPVPPARQPPTPPVNDPTNRSRNRDGTSKAAAIVQASAARLLRKEIAAVQKHAVKFAADGDAFTAWITEFYLAHAALVVLTLQMSQADADGYCWSQAQQIVNGGGWVAALELWQAPGYAAGLAALALEDDEAA